MYNEAINFGVAILLGIGNPPAPIARKNYTSPKEEMLSRIATRLCHRTRLSHFDLTTIYNLFVVYNQVKRDVL